MPPRPSRSKLFRWPFCATLLALCLGLAARAETPSDAQILLNQKRMEIRQLIELVSRETRRTILFDEQVRGVVSLVAKRPVTPDESWEILGSALHMLGYSLVPSTVDQWRIVRIADALGESPFVAKAGNRSDRYVTALIPIEHASLQPIVNVVQSLAGTGVTVVPFFDTNSMIASGPERAIARLTVVADELDRVEERALRQRVLRYRGVAEVEAMVQLQFDGGVFNDRDLEIWSDERTSSVIYRGEDEAVERLIAFLEKVDQPVEGEGQIRILRVLNRDATDIAQILGGQAPTRRPSSTRTGSRKQDDPAGGSEQDDGDRTETRDQQDDTDESTTGPSADPLDPSQPEPQVAATGGQPLDLQTLLGGEDYSIAVDEPTRSLVVRASERGHRLIRELVEELDQPPQLIAVDITISELRTPSTWALALSYHVPLLPGDSLDELVGRLISTPAGRGFGVAPIAPGALFGRASRDAGIDFDVPGEGGVQIPLEDTAVIDASDIKFRNEILIQPSLVITAGDEHEIFVGDNIPIPVSSGSSLGNAGGSQNPFVNSVTFNREDVGVRITLEAQAGKEGPIVLQVDTEISSLAPAVAQFQAGDPSKVGPTLIKETLSAKARLEDGETAVIGVDRERVENLAEGGTPWLSDIPFLGWLFKARGNQTRDVRLIIAARARRIATPAEFAADTIRRRLAFERQSAREEHLPDAEGSPYGVRVTTRTLEQDADAIAQDLEGKGHRTTIHRWRGDERRDLFDVYVMGLESMVDAGELAYRLAEDGWDADLVVFSPES